MCSKRQLKKRRSSTKRNIMSGGFKVNIHAHLSYWPEEEQVKQVEIESTDTIETLREKIIDAYEMDSTNFTLLLAPDWRNLVGSELSNCGTYNNKEDSTIHLFLGHFY